MNFDHFPADRLRAVPLETVLTLLGARRDRHDRAKWHTERGPLSVTGAKFMNWHQHRGGGGAIDLVMHLAGVNYGTALRWLQTYASAGLPASSPPAADPAGGKRQRPACRTPCNCPCPILAGWPACVSTSCAVGDWAPRCWSRCSNRANCTRTATPMRSLCCWPERPSDRLGRNCVGPDREPGGDGVREKQIRDTSGSCRSC